MDAATSHHFSFATLWEHLRQDRRYLAGIGLCIPWGVPFQLIYYTQSDWWTQSGVALHTIGLMSELTIAYKFNFLAGRRSSTAMIRRCSPSWLGRRRAWIVCSQILCMMALAGIALGHPAHFLAWTVAFSLALGFVGATQDITIDGWRINICAQGQAGR